MVDEPRQFKVTTFGGLCILDHDGAPIGLQSDRARALFLMLLTHRNHMLHREAICAALWPAHGERQARAQLSKSLWRLRSTFAPDSDDDRSAVISQAECLIGLQAECFDADCWRLADIVKAVEFTSDEDLSLEDAQALSDIVSACQGAFGVGIFDEWCDEFREFYSQLLIDAMNRLVGYHRSRSNWSMAISWGRRAIQLDPCREDLHLAVISGFRSMGNHASAIQQYRACERILASELHIGPSSAMQSMLRELTP